MASTPETQPAANEYTPAEAWRLLGNQSETPEYTPDEAGWLLSGGSGPAPIQRQPRQGQTGPPDFYALAKQQLQDERDYQQGLWEGARAALGNSGIDPDQPIENQIVPEEGATWADYRKMRRAKLDPYRKGPKRTPNPFDPAPAELEIDPQRIDTLALTMRVTYEANKQALENMDQWAQRIVGANEGARLALANTYARMVPPDKRNQFLQMVAQYAKENPRHEDQNVFANLLDSYRVGLQRMAVSTERTAQAVPGMLLPAPGDVATLTAPSGPAPTKGQLTSALWQASKVTPPEERAAEPAVRMKTGDLFTSSDPDTQLYADLIYGTLRGEDPLTKGAWYDPRTWPSKAAEQLPVMAAGVGTTALFGVVPGAMAFFPSIFADRRNQYLMDGMTEEHANAAALVTGVAESAIEQMETLVPFLPGVRKASGEVFTTVKSALWRFAKGLLKEDLEEGLQDASAKLTRDLFAPWLSDLEQQGINAQQRSLFEDFVVEPVKAMVEAAGPLIVMLGPGGARNVVTAWQNSQQELDPVVRKSPEAVPEAPLVSLDEDNRPPITDKTVDAFLAEHPDLTSEVTDEKLAELAPQEASSMLFRAMVRQRLGEQTPDTPTNLGLYDLNNEHDLVLFRDAVQKWTGENPQATTYLLGRDTLSRRELNKEFGVRLPGDWTASERGTFLSTVKEIVHGVQGQGQEGQGQGPQQADAQVAGADQAGAVQPVAPPAPPAAPAPAAPAKPRREGLVKARERMAALATKYATGTDADAAMQFVLDNHAEVEPADLYDALRYRTIRDAASTAEARAAKLAQAESITLGELGVGDTFKIAGKEFKVTAKDEQANEITLADGVRLQLPTTYPLPVDAGSVVTNQDIPEDSTEFAQKSPQEQAQIVATPYLEAANAQQEQQAAQLHGDERQPAGPGGVEAGGEEARPSERGQGVPEGGQEEAVATTDAALAGQDTPEKPPPPERMALMQTPEAKALAAKLFGQAPANQFLDPDLWVKLSRFVGKAIEIGHNDFKSLMRTVKEGWGVFWARHIAPSIAGVWNSLAAKWPVLGVINTEEIDKEFKLADPVLEKYQRNYDRDSQWAKIDAVKHTNEFEKITGEKRYTQRYADLSLATYLWNQLRSLGDEAGAYLAEWRQVVPEQYQHIITLAENLPADLQKFATRIVDENTLFGMLFKTAGALKDVLENYAATIWKPEEGEYAEGMPSKFNTRTGRQKQKTYRTVLEGWADGRTLAIGGLIDAQQIAREQMFAVIHNKQLLKEGIDAGIFDVRQRPGWVKVDHPNFTVARATGVVKNALPEDIQNFGPRGNSFLVAGRGGAVKMERVPLYAAPKLANILNNQFGQSKLMQHAPVRMLMKATNTVNLMKLSLDGSQFDQYARAHFVTVHDLLRNMNPIQAGQEGYKAALAFRPMVQEGVEHGLKLTASPPDVHWELIKQGRVAQGLARIPIVNPTFTYEKVLMGLKTFWYLIEMKHQMKKNAARLARGQVTRGEIASAVATAANDVWGGLNLKRMARNPDLQTVLRLTLIAPDYTEARIRMFKGMFRNGEQGRVYRDIWARVATRTLASTIIGGMVLAAGDDRNYWQRMSDAWYAGNWRWLDVDVTPIYHALGGDADGRKYISTLGQYKDPIRWLGLLPGAGSQSTDDWAYFTLDKIPQTLKQKSSFAAQAFWEAVTGTDWAGRRFTTMQEMLDWNDKGTYMQTATHERPKGGGIGNFGPSRAGWWIHQSENIVPISVQNGLEYVMGYQSGWDAMLYGFMGVRGAAARAASIERNRTRWQDAGHVGPFDRLAQ